MDCSTNKTTGWVIGDRSIKTAKKLYEKLKHLDAVFYVDDWDPYKGVIPEKQHIVADKKSGKTNIIERFNCKMR
ncbi:transposase (fragment) [groundwater metagenome]|uniref:Transposase n=1 Tax=groundwater metagenome TaxID=717931 RepID=A0A098E6S9_9ZZZZ